jgi:hypothetical protein
LGLHRAGAGRRVRHPAGNRRCKPGIVDCMETSLHTVWRRLPSWATSTCRP